MTLAAAHSSHAPVIMWFREDLRLGDNPALTAAAQTGRPILCVFVLDDDTPGEWRLGGASRWWLHGALAALMGDVAAKGGRMILARGRAEEMVLALAEQVKAAGVYWNRSYQPFAIDRDTAVKSALKDRGVDGPSHNGRLLFEPWRIKTGSGAPYRVFTPFWKACRAEGLPADPLPAPDTLLGWTGDVDTAALDDLALLPTKPDWAGGLRDAWTCGEAAAQNRLTQFLDTALEGYGAARDLPGVRGTSRLSPHLCWGEISPRQVVAAVANSPHSESDDAASFLSEIGWREFSHSLLYHYPSFPDDNYAAKFNAFPWRDDAEARADLDAWRRGQTGYPIVDAGMRELYETGWMHNRVRMIVGSFLCKHLLIHWRAGERWFWDCLVDADLANNAAGWQWIAGTGADAAPYFRIFNPITQGEKFDPGADYVRRWVPELKALSDKIIHQPWTASARQLASAGVRLGESYPEPIIEHKRARDRALEAFQSLKTAA